MKTKEEFVKYSEDLDSTLATDEECWMVHVQGYNAGFAGTPYKNPHYFSQSIPEAEDKKATKRENMFYRIWHSAYNEGKSEGKDDHIAKTARLRMCPFRKQTDLFTGQDGVTETTEDFLHCIGESCQAWNHERASDQDDICLLISQRRINHGA